MLGLFCLFFLITLGLGYPILNRYDPRQIAGLTDVKSYAALVIGSPPPGPAHLRFRVLVPLIARPLYLIARGHVNTWDPVMLGLLICDAMFAAATALLIVLLGADMLLSQSVSLVAALLYLLNFATPNLRLVGSVDAGEGFFLLALLWSLSQGRFWLLPLISVLGSLTKESFIPFSIVFMAAWWLATQSKAPKRAESAWWIASSCIAGLAAFAVLQKSVAGAWINPIEFAAALHLNHDYTGHLASSLWDRNLLYVYAWLLPAAIPRLNRLPKSWLLATAAATAVAFVLDGYYGGAPGTLGRALFSIAGPILALSSAVFVCGYERSEGGA